MDTRVQNEPDGFQRLKAETVTVKCNFSGRYPTIDWLMETTVLIETPFNCDIRLIPCGH